MRNPRRINVWCRGCVGMREHGRRRDGHYACNQCRYFVHYMTLAGYYGTKWDDSLDLPRELVLDG